MNNMGEFVIKFKKWTNKHNEVDRFYEGICNFLWQNAFS